MDFVPLRTHSWFSFLTAPSSPAALCRQAQAAGWSALALTDVGGLWGAAEFATAAAGLGVRPLLGVELPTAEGRLVLLVRDAEGYRSLTRLISAFHLDEDFDPVRTPAREAAGLLMLADRPRFLARLALRIPPDSLFVGLPPPGGGGAVPAPALAPEDVIPQGRKLPNPPRSRPVLELREAARQLGLSLVALPDIYRARPAERERQRALLAVKGGTIIDLVGDPGGHDLPGPEMIRHWYRGDEAALARTVALAEQCRFVLPRDREPVFPPYRSVAGESAEERLEQVARAALVQIYGESNKEALARLREELALICAAGFAPYFLLLREIVEFARREGIPCMGRGSAADSLVARCLGLTEPDPLRYGLVFERFLNPGRGDLPDVDLDFCWRRREQVVRHVYERYGAGRVATLCTLVRFGVRGAVREAALACGVPPRLATNAVASLPHYHAQGVGGAMGEAADLVGSLGASSLARRVGRVAECLLDVPHHLGLHPGGTVVVPFPLRDLIPLQHSAEGLVATQFDKHYIEETGAVKLDLLGNRGLTLVDYALAIIRKSGRQVPDLEVVDEQDRTTARLLREGRSLGCFQVESPAMRQLLKALGVTELERVIQALALVRPGPAAGGMKQVFLRRATGREPTPTLHPLFDRVLADTYGVMLYQEDVLRVTEAVTGISMAAADRLRKELGRNRHDPAALARLARAFVLKAGERGVPRAVAREIWEQVERFSGYSFCKAHAVSYGRLAWKCAWLKAHEPAVFMAALLSSGAGMYAKTVYVDEARRLGLRILSPHVNHSAERWQLVGESDLRPSLGEVRGLGTEAVAAIIASRAGQGPFADLADLRRRVTEIPRDALENLVLAGALDGLGANRGDLVLSVRLGREWERQEETAWFGAPLPELDPAEAVALPGPDRLERARLELEVLGFCPGVHPLRLRGCARGSGTTGCGLALTRSGRLSLEGWVIASRRVNLGGGDWVLFFTLEDETGLVEVVSRPGGGRPGQVEPGAVLAVAGRVAEHLGAPAIQADRVHRLSGIQPA